MSLMPPLKISDAKDFGRVAVAMGGDSAEREVSLNSGAAVLAALHARGVDATGIDAAGASLIDQLRDGNFARVFIALHGRGGEDGRLQGALDLFGIPYTGSDALASAIGMDKVVTKRIWTSLGLPTPQSWVFGKAQDQWPKLAPSSLPVMVKPAREGSSVGMQRVSSLTELTAAVEAALDFDETVLVEQWIDGPEYTAATLQGTALPIIRLETPNSFYDYEAKYLADNTQYHCPAGLAAEDESAVRALTQRAFGAVGASGWGRVDFMRDADGKTWLLEVNTVPGMTTHSLVPMAAAAAGIEMDELVWRILETSL